MEITKKIDLGEYVVVIKYDEATGSLSISVLDELEDEIERIDIENDDDEEDDDPFNGMLN